MAGKKEEIVIDVRSAVKLEQELQAHIDHGVVLIDVYSAEWGPCKALAETFRALNNDSGAKLRILSAECHAILASIKNPEERNHHRPKNMEAIRETLPEAWQGVLEERAGLAKPFFLIYKEGRRCAAIDGVNTPAIRGMVKELRAVRQPPETFLSGPLLALWKAHLHRDESEIAADKFCKAVLPMAEVDEPLTSEERGALLEALGAKESKIVTADSFLRWVGDDGSVATSFHASLPAYAERAAKAKTDREAEDRAAEAAKQEEEERAAREEEAQKSSQADAAAANIARWSAAAGMTEAEAKDTAALRAARKALAVETRDKVAFTATFAPLPEDADESVATALAAALAEAPTLSQFLVANGASISTVHNIRRAAEKRFASADLLAAGKVACLSLTATAAEHATYYGTSDGALAVAESTLAGTVATDFPSVACAAATNGASDAGEGQEALYFTAPADRVLIGADVGVGARLIVPPFAPFSTRGTKKAAAGDVTVILKGAPRAIFTAAATTRPASAVALTAWYGLYEVTAKTEAAEAAPAEGEEAAAEATGAVIELTFVQSAFDAALDSLSQQVRKAQSDEDDVFTAISQLQRAVADKAAAAGEVEQPFDEAVVVEKEPVPEQEDEADPEPEDDEAPAPEAAAAPAPAEGAPAAAEEEAVTEKVPTPTPTPPAASSKPPSKKATPEPSAAAEGAEPEPEV